MAKKEFPDLKPPLHPTFRKHYIPNGNNFFSSFFKHKIWLKITPARLRVRKTFKDVAKMKMTRRKIISHSFFCFFFRHLLQITSERNKHPSFKCQHKLNAIKIRLRVRDGASVKRCRRTRSFPVHDKCACIIFSPPSIQTIGMPGFPVSLNTIVKTVEILEN